MSAADKSRGPYKQFFACECGSRFSNEEELKIHFCLSHHGEKEVKVKVQRIYKNSESPQKIKIEGETSRTTSPVKKENAKSNKNKMKIVSVHEESSKKVITPEGIIKEEKTGYRKVYEDLSQYCKRNDANPTPAKKSYRTIQYPKSPEGVTLYKAEPLEPNVVHTGGSVQKKNIIKPIVIPISQMKPNSYVIQQPAKKPADNKIQVIKCGDNKFLVRNNSPVKNTVCLQQSGGKPVYVIHGEQDGVMLQNVIVQQNPDTNQQVQYVGVKEENETYHQNMADDDTEQFVERNEEQEVEYEVEYDPAGEYITEEYITGDTANDSVNEEEYVEEYEELEEQEEEDADYENILEAHEVDIQPKEEKPKKKYRHKPPKEGEIHQCSVCDRAFRKQMSLTQHMIQVHRPSIVQTELVVGKKKPRAPKEKAVVKCDMCDREFFGHHAIAVHRVKAHLGTDHIVRPFPCELCDKAYRNQTLLNYHMRTHTGDRPYRCSFCPKSFTMAQGLQSHLNTHGSERWSECKYCYKRLISSYALNEHEKNHINIHTNERVFECKICKKRLTSNYRLNDHQKWHERVHTGERPEVCRICDKRFKCQTALMRHEKVHTGDKPYACPHCNKCFSQSNSMKLHVITVHMKLPSPYKSHHNRYRKRREKMLEKKKDAETEEEMETEMETETETKTKKEDPKQEEMEVYFGSEDDAAGYEEVYA